MNALSWLLYGANIASNLGPTLGLTAIFAGCVALGAGIGTVACVVEDVEMPKQFRKVLPVSLTILFVCGGLAVLVPSRDTIMLIAAAEVGETVLASKDVQSIGGEAGALATDSLKLLRKYVTEQLGEVAE